MATSPITSWQIDGETMETVADFTFRGSKSLWNMTAAMKIKRRLLLERKAMTNLDSVLKKKRCHFVDKDLYSQSYGSFSSHVWM